MNFKVFSVKVLSNNGDEGFEDCYYNTRTPTGEG